MDSEDRFFMLQPLCDYHRLIAERFYEDIIIPILLKRIREVASEEDARLVWKKYREWPYTSRFPLYTMEEKIETLKKEREILDYFGIDYPPPPDSIKQFFEIQSNKG